MCLAPCFKGCTDDEYRAEVVRVEDFLNTRGESLKRELAVERDAASSQLEFENAAASHARLEKLGPVLQQMPEVVHRIDRLHALIVQRSAIAEAVAIFRVDEGVIDGPILFPISSPEHTKSQSMEARIEEALASSSEIEVAGKNARSTQERMEHLAILKRWYYRGSRTGKFSSLMIRERCRCAESFAASGACTREKRQRQVSLCLRLKTINHGNTQYPVAGIQYPEKS